MVKKTLFCSLLALILFFPICVHGQDASSEQTQSQFSAAGKVAPALTFSDTLGRSVVMGQYIGKSPVVLSFWSIYCGSCVEEMLSLQKLEDKYQGEGLVIMAINEDIHVSTERIRRFAERLEKFRGKITYPLLYDESSRILNKLGITALPTLVLIDRKGTIAGYYHGFSPEGEIDLAARIDALIRGADENPTGIAALSRERSEYLSVTGEAALCGFFDNTGWRKSFSGSNILTQEMELTRDLARRAATRQALTEALIMFGIKIHSFEPLKGCISPSGIDLGRDPFDTNDPTSNLLGIINYSEFFETIKEQEMLIDRTYYVTRQVRVFPDRLRNELGSIGYIFDPMRITITYVNMDPLDQKDFLSHLLASSKFIGHFEAPVFTSQSTSQVFEVFTSSQGLADEILGIDFGKLQVFVEEVTPTSLELEVWK